MSDLAAKPAMPTVSAVKLKAALLGLASYGTFTLADATVKLQSSAYALAQVTLMLEISAAVILLAIAAASGRVKSVIPRQPGFTYLRALLLAIETALIYYAFATIPMPEAYVIAFMSPILVAVMSYLVFKERLTRIAWAGVVLGFIGVIVALRPGAGEFTAGHLAAIASACLFSVTLLMVKKAHPDESDTALAIAPALLLAIGAAAYLAYSGEWKPLTFAAAATFFAGGAAIVGGSMFLVRAFRLGEPSLVAPTQYSQIVWGTLISYLLFNTGIDAYTIAGAAIIIVSGLLVLK